MKGLEWGRLYEKYHKTKYDPAEVSGKVRQLYSDPCIKKKNGIFYVRAILERGKTQGSGNNVYIDDRIQ